MAKKQMLRELVAQQAGCSIATAERMILAGEVFSGCARLTRPGERVDAEIQLHFKEICPYVSRGAYKLLRALEVFSLDVKDHVCIDAGSSTGGFTQVLLQHGAALVYAVDCGTNQLDFRLRTDKKVIVMENTRVQDLCRESLSPAPEIGVMDVSFTSCLPVVRHLFDCLAVREAAVLIKPQFEYKRLFPVLDLSGEFHGIVDNDDERQKILNHVCMEIQETGICLAAQPVESPIVGTFGNKEYLVHLRTGEALGGKDSVKI